MARPVRRKEPLLAVLAAHEVRQAGPGVRVEIVGVDLARGVDEGMAEAWRGQETG